MNSKIKKPVNNKDLSEIVDTKFLIIEHAIDGKNLEIEDLRNSCGEIIRISSDCLSLIEKLTKKKAKISCNSNKAINH